MEVVGIVGAAGDLGSKMTIQASSVFEDVHTFDISQTYEAALTGVDPALQAATILNKSQTTDSLNRVIDMCSVIHWAAPTESATTIPRLPKSSMLVLHDSVMANSLEAAQKLSSNDAVLGQIVIAHCLTNEERTVVVASGIGNTERLVKHIDELGLVPKIMEIKEHDAIMAHSQALFALVCRVFRDDLKQYASDGMLTPSGHRLLTAIEDNESHWTPATYATITSNPELSSVLQTMLNQVNKQAKLSLNGRGDRT